jgi:hypothetical protein
LITVAASVISQAMMLLLNTVKLVLIALNILPNRMKHKKVMFFIYMGTLVTHGKETRETFPAPRPTPTAMSYEVVNYRGAESQRRRRSIETRANEKSWPGMRRRKSFCAHCGINSCDISNQASAGSTDEREIGEKKKKMKRKKAQRARQMSNFNDGKM